MTPTTETQFKELIERSFPNARAVTNDARPRGFWVDVHIGTKVVAVIEYDNVRGYGISSIDGDEGFGEGPDRIADTPDQAIAALRDLVPALTVQ
ncbi:MAG TPA: hypothetical protein VFT82_03605 [Candidatus Paceibacterota bacterium]|nr:hypothetical protein [Candidatus Paceibacterota bacterium]